MSFFLKRGVVSSSLFLLLSLISCPLSKTNTSSFHIPGMSAEMFDVVQQQQQQYHGKRYQALVGVSMESAPNYPLLSDRDFLARFDVLATLEPPAEKGKDDRKVSSAASASKKQKRIWYSYYDDMFRRCWEAEGNPAATGAATTTAINNSKATISLHLSRLRENAIAYVNSNCDTSTGRDELVKEVADLLKPLGIPLHSFGACLNNMPRSARSDSKIETLRRYKFCVAIENSEDRHYVSEKVYDAFVAGCVPIYFGAPNVLDYVPHADAIVDVRALGGTRGAAEEIAVLATDDEAYASKHAWRDRPETWSEGFKRLQAQTWRDGVGPFEKCDTTMGGLSDPHMRRQCAICKAVAEWRDSR